jgi:hypothetical protein
VTLGYESAPTPNPPHYVVRAGCLCGLDVLLGCLIWTSGGGSPFTLGLMFILDLSAGLGLVWTVKGLANREPFQPVAAASLAAHALALIVGAGGLGILKSI